VRRLLVVLLGVTLFAAAARGDADAESRKLFLRARTAMADGRFREALDLYRKVIERLPEDAILRVEYGQLLRDLNVPEEAERQAREAVRLDPNLAEGHRLLGSLQLAAAEREPQRLPGAISELRAAQRLAPEDAPTAVTLARALLLQGSAAEAARVLDQLPQSRTQPGLMRLAAEAKAKSGQLRAAEELYRALLAANPADREIAAALVDLYEDADRLDDALGVLRALEKTDPENGAIAERITLDLARAGNFAEAEKRARDLAARRPENRGIRRLLAQVLFEKGDVAEGEGILRALKTADPDDDVTVRALSGELIRERRYEEARALLEDLSRRAGSDPKKAETRRAVSVELGFIAMLRKDPAGAHAVLDPIAVVPEGVNARALRILLAVDRDSENFADGLARARAAAAREPQSPEWAAAEAEFTIRSGDRKKGEEALARLASSSEPEPVLAAADAYSRLKDYPSAVRVARDAAKRFPDSSEALFRLGSSLERAGSPAEAEEVFRKLLAERPNDSAAQNYLGYMWADNGVHLQEALGLIEKAVAREPRNGAYLDSLGWAYFRLGRLESAEKSLLEAKRREPDDPTIEEHLGDLMSHQGNLERAREHWERALALKPDEPEKIRRKIEQIRGRVTNR
jgi:tetratricopeptide (TPR) repeat protein